MVVLHGCHFQLCIVYIVFYIFHSVYSIIFSYSTSLLWSLMQDDVNLPQVCCREPSSIGAASKPGT